MMIFHHDQTQDSLHQEGKALTFVQEGQLLTPDEKWTVVTPCTGH